jgi:hypothetical protein
MKPILALAASIGAALVLALVTPAEAQKDQACIEKCNRENISSGGGSQTRGTAQRVRACITACPKASGKAK